MHPNTTKSEITKTEASSPTVEGSIEPTPSPTLTTTTRTCTLKKKRAIEQLSDPTEMQKDEPTSKKREVQNHDDDDDNYDDDDNNNNLEEAVAVHGGSEEVGEVEGARIQSQPSRKIAIQPPPHSSNNLKGSSALLVCEETKNNRNDYDNPTQHNTAIAMQTQDHSSSAFIQRKRNVESHHSVLPLSMQIMRPFYVLCCQNCEDTRNGRLSFNHNGRDSTYARMNENYTTTTTNNEQHHQQQQQQRHNDRTTRNSNNPTRRMRKSVPSFINQQNGRVIMEQVDLSFSSTTGSTRTPDSNFGHVQHHPQPLYNGYNNHHSQQPKGSHLNSNNTFSTTTTSIAEGGREGENPNDTIHTATTTAASTFTETETTILESPTQPPKQQQQTTQIMNKNRLKHLTTIPPSPQEHTNPIMQEYISTTQIYGCKVVNPGVLTAIRFSLPTIRVSGSFHDIDMLSLAEILFRHCNGALSHVKRLDFSVASREGKLHGKRGFGSHGAFTLSRVLCISENIEEVFLQRNRIGPYGAAAIFAAVAKNKKLRTLVMRRCLLGERGALAFAEYVGQSQDCGLKEVDLSVNRIGFKGSIAIEEMLNEKERMGMGIDVDLEGNLVLQEVMNGVTHGLGIVLCVVGAVLMSRRVKNYSRNHVISCGIYSVSLLVLYTSSTLYHSFFALKYTRYIFEVLDHCAIYILITGSYTPFLRIALEDSPSLSFYLLAFQWFCCICGIFVEAFYNNWIHKPTFTLAMYLGMGWACMICMPQFIEVLPKEAINLLVLGGVGYTSGVPFFVRNNNLDHSIWHCFVLAGSIFHWFAVYQYVTPMGRCRGGELIDENMLCMASS